MGEYVWILPRNNKITVPIGAQILSRANNRISVRDEDNNEYCVSPKDILRPMHPTSVVGVEDMTTLGDLQEYAILRNLLIRYRKDFIYTYVGSILVAVNPYKPLPIYGSDKMAEYRKKKLGELPPHIFAVADHSYESMRRMSEKRCVVISGESGAGKTESTKLFLQYFATISPKLSGKERQILDSNPILEAFGNAKTICNDNSSRFGKYISIYFCANGSIHSAEIKHYLLEKSRIVSQNKGEENYHIFYALLNGLNEDKKRLWKLTDASTFKYLNRAPAQTTHSAEINTYRNLQTIISAMKVLNFNDTEIWQIFEIIAAILHLGNIDFEMDLESNIETVKSVTKDVQTACSLLRVSEEHLKTSLTKKIIATQGDTVIKLLSKKEAINSRDAFVKKIFGALFNYIVEKINENLSEGKNNTQHHIGILDIFGFETFNRNSFEQLCINYANERLQQFFIKHSFKIEQETYAVEGIAWKFVEYPDNKEILELIEEGPNSILSIINDCTKIPRETDESMLAKLIENHSTNPNFLKPKFNKIPVFGIQHFAGIVLYDIKDIIDKNYDSYNMDFKQVIQLSDNDFLKRIFASDFEADDTKYYKRRLETLASKFKSSLDSLMSELNECQPFFVRCIKPNEMKKPQNFDRMLCCNQLKYSGMTEVTKVREAGYPVRYDYVEFVQRYRVLVPGMPLASRVDCRAATEKICQTTFKTFKNPDYKLGYTKIFLKHAEELFLEAEKERVLYYYAVRIQKLIRGWLVRRRQLNLKKAVLLAENCWLEKQKCLQSHKIRGGFHRLQAKLKSRFLVLQFKKYQRLMTHLQAYCRGYLLRKSIKHKFQKTNQLRKSLVKANESVSFKSFAKNYFQNNQSYKYSKKPIKTSLTQLFHPEEVAAAKAIWLTILRFTKNVSEPTNSSKMVPVRDLLREILQMIGSKNALSSAATNVTTSDNEKISGLYENWLKRQTTELEKLHFIIGHGIKRPELRDEIYCQLCKMLTKNPSKKKTHRGWELLTCCIGCFPPSDLFLRYLKTFIRKGHKKYTSFCLFRLHRLMQNGCRTRPPFETEFLAIKRQKPVQLEVLLMDGGKTSGKIDSATTARELLDIVAKSIKLTDVFGFGFVLQQGKKQWSLDDGSSFVLDAISECEQYIAEVERESDSTTWKMYLKKEMFAPWCDLLADEVSTNLAYHQIKEGIITGEYGHQNPELPSVIAQICYAEEGKVKPLMLKNIIRRYTPLHMSDSDSDDFKTLEKQVEKRYQEMCERSNTSAAAVRFAVVKNAALNWTFQFSRFFHVFGSVRNLRRTDMQSDLEAPLLIGVNYAGILVIDESSEKRVRVQMDYQNIYEIRRKQLVDSNGYTLKIISCEAVEVSLTFQSAKDNDFHQLLNKILDTLKKYSKYVMAIKDYMVQDKSFLELKQGDLIALSDNLYGEDLLLNGWSKGTNKRSEKTGNFLLECVEIIRTIKTPAESSLKARRDLLLHGKGILMGGLVERYKHYTLQSFSKKFFKSADKSSDLWKYSKQPIKQPLLAKLASNSEMAKEAVTVFKCILQYTENCQNKTEVDEELLYNIFTPGLENDELKNETYCQILKQLTSNPEKLNESRAWELMWLITGLFDCEENLANEVKKFLQARRTITTARECLIRFNEVLGKEPRKCSPHIIEIEAVKNRPCHIFHRVYFPDVTNKFFKIHSLTKFKDLKEAVYSRLNLNSQEKFSLFVQFLGRLFLAPEDCYIFDCLQNYKLWTDKKKIHDWEYKICFMKTEWKVSPTSHINEVTDLKFIFPQEYNKYIHGFYDIPKEDILQLAALLYKLHEADEKTQNFQTKLEKLVPSKAMQLMKLQSWQDAIETNYRNSNLSSENDCKIKFLKYLSKFIPNHSLPYFTVLPENSDVKNYMFYSITQRS